MTSGLPTERDFAPSGALDEQCAWRHFGGLTLEEAYGKFASAPESYHLEHFVDDWDEPLQMEDNWRKLQEYICQYETG